MDDLTTMFQEDVLTFHDESLATIRNSNTVVPVDNEIFYTVEECTMSNDDGELSSKVDDEIISKVKGWTMTNVGGKLPSRVDEGVSFLGDECNSSRDAEGVVSKSDKDCKVTGFLDLPGEIRNMIYSDLIDLQPSLNSPSLTKLPSLALTSWQTLHEFTSLLFHKTSIKIASTTDLWNIQHLLYFPFYISIYHVSYIPQMIKTFHICGLGRIAPSPSHAEELMDFCVFGAQIKNLQISINLMDYHMPVILNIPHGPVDNWPGDDAVLSSYTPASIAQKYFLGRLLQMRHLKKVTITGLDSNAPTPTWTLRLFWDLRKWLQDAFDGLEGVESTSMKIFERTEESVGAFELKINRV